jgi:hypothetical protein
MGGIEKNSSGKVVGIERNGVGKGDERERESKMGVEGERKSVGKGKKGCEKGREKGRFWGGRCKWLQDYALQDFELETEALPEKV